MCINHKHQYRVYKICLFHLNCNGNTIRSCLTYNKLTHLEPNRIGLLRHRSMQWLLMMTWLLNPADTWPNHNVIITPKRSCNAVTSFWVNNDVIIRPISCVRWPTISHNGIGYAGRALFLQEKRFQLVYTWAIYLEVIVMPIVWCKNNFT